MTSHCETFVVVFFVFRPQLVVDRQSLQPQTTTTRITQLLCPVHSHSLELTSNSRSQREMQRCKKS